MIKEFIVTIKIKDKDFSPSDLQESILDGIENVGNFEVQHVKVELLDFEKRLEMSKDEDLY